VQALRAAGKGIKPMMRELGLAKETVRRFCRATSVEELLAKPREGRPSILDQFKPYLLQRWRDGHTCATRLFEEIRAQGYRGSAGIVRNYLRPFRELGSTPPRAPAPPKVRDLTSWLLRHPDSLDTNQQLKCKEVLARCPDLDAVASHVAAFAEIMCGLHGDRLHGWIAKVEADQLPDLHSFTAGLKRGTSKRYVYTYPAKKALRAVMAKVKTVCWQNSNLPLETLLHQLNRLLRGWTAYFKYGSSSATFNYLRAYTWKQVFGWLRRKHRRSGWKELRRRYTCDGWWPAAGR